MAVSNGGNAIGGVAVATTGNASGQVAITGTGSAGTDILAASGTGDAYTTRGDNGWAVAVSGTGNADAPVRATGNDGPDATYPIAVPGEIILGPVMAVMTGSSLTSVCVGVCATDGDRPDGYACEYCSAYAAMSWSDSGNKEQVRAIDNYNEAAEVIDRQDNHAVLLKGSGKCYTGDAYDGEQVWRAFSGDVYGWASGPNLESGWYSGSNKTWTVANGHNWQDGDMSWSISDGTTDVCHKF